MNDIPTISNAGASQTLCISSPTTVMTANTATVGVGVWTLVSGSGTITNSLSPTTSITGLALGANVFAWTISNAPCLASVSTVTLFVNDIPTVANAGTTQTLCISSPTTSMNANFPAVGTGVWTLVSGSGVITNSLLPTTTITGLALGTNVFAWTISNAPCLASTATVAIIVNDIPTVSNAGTSQTLCISSPTTAMTANTATVGTGVWTLVSGSGTITNSLSPTTSITGLAIGANVFAWTISNAPCLASVSTVTLFVNDIPTLANAGISQTICISSPTTIMTANTATVGTGVWTLVSGGGSITNSLSPTTSITGLPLGTNVFQWTISNAPCLASSSTMTIEVKDVPTIANAGFSQTVCITSPNAFMNANTATVGVGTWSLISGSGTITNSLSPTTSITGLGLGLNIFEWTISNNPCSASSSTVSILVNDLPTPSNAGTTQTLCISSPTTTMTANTPTIGTGMWTLVSGSGTITSPTSPNSIITGLGLGNNVFAWTISNMPCLSSVSNVTLVVNDVPTVSNAGITQTLCISSPTTVMTANTATVGVGTWSLVAGTGIITNSLSPTTSITGLGLGANVFEWTISNPPCLASVSSVTLFVDDVPTISTVGPAQNLCASNSTLTGNAPIVGTGLWTVIAGGSSVTTPTLNNSTVSSLITGTNTLVWTISNGVCASSSSTLNLFVNPFPSPAVAGTDQTVCTATANLFGINPAIGFGTWSILTGTSAVTTPTSATSGVTGLSNGANTFVWTTSYGTCPNNSDTVTIFRDSLPTTSVAGINQTLCLPTTTLNANAPLVGIGTWSVISGGSSVTTTTLNTSGVTSLATGTNIFEWSIVNGVCPASTSTVLVFVDSYPTPSNAGTDFTICASTSTLNSNIPTIGTGVWSVIVGGSSVTTPTLNASQVTGLANGVNSFIWTTSNGTCPSSTSTVTIFRDSLPTISVAGANQTLCLPTTTLNANAPIVGVGTWSVITGGSSVTTPTLNTSGVTSLATGTNIFEWSIVNGVCPASTSTVLVFVDSYPTPSNAGTDFTICASTSTLNSNIPTIGTGVWSVIAGVLQLQHQH
ncbi:MAG: hypothetical protein IPJ32_12460 [Sphingobacteriaceae bacterium]|nr:hypothetical protein [Sphingobacteriaceae bacterium]